MAAFITVNSSTSYMEALGMPFSELFYLVDFLIELNEKIKEKQGGETDS